MKIAVFFPGIGYRFNKPLLYYSKKLAKECGYDTFLEVDYRIKKTTNIRGNAEKMREAFDEACESAEKFLAPIPWQEYDEIVFISKSIGTAVAAHFTNVYRLKAKRFIIHRSHRHFWQIRRRASLFAAPRIRGFRMSIT